VSFVILFGHYRWAAQRLAYRNDYCLRCDTVRLAELIRTFDVGHLFYAPLLPLGYRKRWHCSVCGSAPYDAVATSQGIKVLAAVACAVFAIVFWLIPIERPEDATIGWGSRLAFSLAFLGALAWCRTAPPTNLKEQLAMVPPLPRDACALCAGALDEREFCHVCSAQRLDLNAPARVVR